MEASRVAVQQPAEPWRLFKEPKQPRQSAPPTRVGQPKHTVEPTLPLLSGSAAAVAAHLPAALVELPAVVWQPVQAPSPFAAAAVQDSFHYCETVARQKAKNFYLAFRLLPKSQRLAMCALYTYLRHTDDLGDDPGPLASRRQALNDLQTQLLHYFQSEPKIAFESNEALAPWWPALWDTVQRYQIEPFWLHAVLAGVRSDLTLVRHETFAELYRYCYQVASAVGMSCIRIWQATAPEADQYAEWCGIAFQLTNILRDIVEDYHVGRIYLPLEDLQRFQLQERDLIEPRQPEHWLAFMQFQIARAHDYYDRAQPLLNYLPGPGRAVLQTMVHIYRGLLIKMERAPSAVLQRRVSLSKMHKISLFLNVWLQQMIWGKI